MTKCVALDYAKEKIRANAVCPGDTFVKRWLARDRADVVEEGEDVDDEEVERRLRISSDIPMGRTGYVYTSYLDLTASGHVDEIANAVLFLASNESSFVTGTTLVVDGGNTAQ